MIYDDDGLRIMERERVEGVTLRKWLRWHLGDISIALCLILIVAGIVAA